MHEYAVVKVDAGHRAAINISHVESPENFYCRLESFSAKLDDLMDLLERFYSSGEFATPNDSIR